MSEQLTSQIVEVLNGLKDPYTDKSITAAKALKHAKVTDQKVSISLVKGYPVDSVKQELSELIHSALSNIDLQSRAVEIEIDSDIISHSVQKGVKPIEGVKNIIAVASGKGGVGKSTVSANLALALAASGAKVGVLDADIYGPSQPRMLGLAGKPEAKENKMLLPLENYGLKVMSIGFMIEEDTPMIWRGPMVTQALEQMLRQTDWGELDYMIIDLPPGTGDIQLTLSQRVPVTGSVIVTTPQDIALLDARKAFKMFEKVEVPILGVIENMSSHVCSQCGHEEAIFGTGGAEKMSDEYKLPFLGGIPLELAIRQQADNGKPTVVAEPDSKTAKRYIDVALKVAGKLSVKKKDFSARFPNIVVENN